MQVLIAQKAMFFSTRHSLWHNYLMNRNWFICGFSGSGKSTLLNMMRRFGSCGLKFGDLDNLILQKYKKNSILEIVNAYGWDDFRNSESKCLSDWVGSNLNSVLALGGGALSNKNLNYLPKENLIWLNSSFEISYERMNKGSVNHRPLLQKSKQELSQLYLERSELFKQAKYKIEASQQSLSELVGKVFEIIHN